MFTYKHNRITYPQGSELLQNQSSQNKENFTSVSFLKQQGYAF